MTRTEALRKLYKKVTDEEAPITANTITEVLVALANNYSGDEPVEANTITDALVALADNYDGGITPTGKITITENGTGIDIAEYATADVSVSGGSSDFSTAEVTFEIGEGLTDIQFNTMIDYPPDNEQSTNDFSYGASYVIGDTMSPTRPIIDSVQIVQMLLYRGAALIYLPICASDGSQSDTVSVGGDAEIDTDLNAVRVSGACTITVDNWTQP